MIFAACSAFTLAVLVYIFWVPGEVIATPEKTRLAYLLERKDVVYENLRDLNFEYNADKLPEADYQSMKSSLEDEAAKLLAEISALEMNPHASYVTSGRQKGARI